MKKLGKLTLKEMEKDFHVLRYSQMDTFVGGSGSIDDNDCFFESLVYIGSWLGYNNQDINSWFNCYGSTYGGEALIDAVNGGVDSDTIMDFLSMNFNSASYVSLNDFSSSSGETMGFLNSGNGNGHAVIINNVENNMVTYFDPQLQAYNVAYTSQFSGAVNIN